MDKQEIKDYFKDLSVEVIGGLILALVLAILGALWLLAPKVLQSIWQGITAVGGFLLSPVSLPVWVIGIIIGLSALEIVSFSTRYVANKKEPTLKDYNEDFIFEMYWRWERISKDNLAIDLWPFCNTCSTRLRTLQSAVPVSSGASKGTKFICETCDKEIGRIKGGMDDFLGSTQRQIERRIITGEWKDVVRRSKAGSLVPKVEEGE